MRIFSGTANRPLAKEIVKFLGIKLGDADITRFSDREISVKYNENIRGIDVFIIQPTCPPADNLLELLLMIDAAKRASAKRVTAVIPYFGYARQDRKDQPRVALSAKLMANLISKSGADRILTLDLHSPSIQGFFDIPFDHLYSSTIFMDHIKNMNLKNLIVVGPDVGSSKRARAYANRLNADFALVDKRRIEANAVDKVTLIGDVKGKDVVLVDDIIDTAGTLCMAAEKINDSGARIIFAACTHPILSGEAVSKLQNSFISGVVVTNTILVPRSKMIDKIKVLSSASLLGEAIVRIHREESISSLFYQPKK